MKKGFTLVELLVVVIIIGILAAFAMPQYEKAVASTRVMTLVPLLRSIADAEHLYYMRNGKYTLSFAALAIQMPGGAEHTTGEDDGDVLTYKDFVCFLRYGGDGTDPSLYSAYCNSTRSNYPSLERYFSKPYSICWVSQSNTKGYDICKNISGKETHDSANSSAYGFRL